MNHCNNCGIVHNDKFCPLCEAEKRIDELKKANEKLEKKVKRGCRIKLRVKK